MKTENGIIAVIGGPPNIDKEKFISLIRKMVEASRKYQLLKKMCGEDAASFSDEEIEDLINELYPDDALSYHFFMEGINISQALIERLMVRI